ncbi:complement component C8 alpha chain [Arvicola amphibius]|uniref:complement component C8 alpha chain n=1 Tax=Arvicola amphibius TaxID=1047088 RepID=UPI0018E3DE77|nr:complement component C8 alpha chain [Arvicola amphibius]
MLVFVLFGLSLMPWHPWVTAQEKVNKRVSRAVTPEPVACQLGSWSEWTDCFPCQDTKYRHRSLLQPSKFGGAICSGDIWDEASCNSPTPCLRQAQCGQDFQCRETGRCLKRHLVCNGENDCLDGSDEDNCEDAMITEDDCHLYDPIPGSERAALGYNILTQEEALSVYDAKYYGGQCETVYNGEWRKLQYDPVCERLYYGDDEKYFRKPYNFLKYHFEGLADTLISSEFYDDVNELFSKIKKGASLSGGMTFGIGPPKVPVTLDLSVSGSRTSSLMNQLSKYNEKRFSFMRVSTKVQTANFKMRRHNIVLDEGMQQSLMELPEQFNYGMYAKFINDYGTHYITSGTMGGIYEYILVLDKEKMAAASVTAKDIGYCIGGSLGLEFGEQITVDGGLSGNTCGSSGAANTDKKDKNSAVEGIISRVQGGSSDWASGLTENRSIITYRSWGRSLKYNPVVIDFEMQPIYELLRHTNLGSLETKRQNLRRALDQYLMEFNACRCGPCFNNGEAILQGTSCKCQCSRGRQGTACEKMGLEGVKADGRWSCWSSWSECRAGTQERRRQCNNPAPQNGGAPCPGKSTQTRAC